MRARNHRPIPNRRSPVTRPDAFTLIELLVVVAIISILAAMLLPALQNAKFQAQKTRGMSNLRQVALAAHLYYDDYNGKFPDDAQPPSNAAQLLVPYVSSNLLYATKDSQPEPNFYCIVNPTTPYGVIMANLNLMGGIAPSFVATYRHSLSDVQRPATTFLIAHNFNWGTSTPIHFDQLLDGSFAGTYSPPYSNKGLSFSFADGHIEFLSWKGSGASRWWDFHPLYPLSYPSTWFSGGYLIYGP